MKQPDAPSEISLVEAGRRLHQELGRLIEEAKSRNRERFCKANEFEDHAPSRVQIESYIVGDFDIFATAGLAEVIDNNSLDDYLELLKLWCMRALPDLESQYSPPLKARNKAELRHFKQVLGEDRVLGKIDRGKITESISYWQAEAMARVRRLDNRLLLIHARRLQGTKIADCLNDAYSVYATEAAELVQPLSEIFLAEYIPSCVLNAALNRQWLGAFDAEWREYADWKKTQLPKQIESWAAQSSGGATGLITDRRTRGGEPRSTGKEKEGASASTNRKAEKGNVATLRGKEFVTVETACAFGGVGRRAIEKAVRKGSLLSEGEGPNRRISAASLLKYFPPENNAN